MIIEGIKNLLGEDLTKQVETALKGKGKDGKDVDLVIGNDGSFVPAEKYNGANSGKTSAENALKAAAEALKAIGGSGDPAKIAEDEMCIRDRSGRMGRTGRPNPDELRSPRLQDRKGQLRRLLLWPGLRL